MFEELAALSPDLTWILASGLVIAFLLAFSVGANDVSNSFGTSVGSKVLTVTQACILATFFEVAGATLLGYSVCDTFRRNVYDVSQYDGAQRELMLGALSCLIGSAAWNMIATYLKMPISGTHSIVGATMGFSLVLRGWDSIKWLGLARIVASWFASPLISGAISSVIYLFIWNTITSKLEPLKKGLKVLPLFYGATVFINVVSVVIGGPEVFGLNKLPWYAGLCIALVISAIVICFTALVMVPKLQDSIASELAAIGKKPPALGPGHPKSGSYSSGQSAPVTTSFSSGLDNPTFQKDEPKLGVQSESKTTSAVSANTEDPKPLELDVTKLGESPTTSKRPPIAPKPAFLMRRQDRFEDVELGPAGRETKSVQLVSTMKGKKDDLEAGQLDPNRPGWIGGERLEIFRLFASLQVMTACFASFAHGTNDVSNAVAPLIPIWNIYTMGFEDINQPTQIWILAFGGIGICTGLWAWGRAVMSTVGTGLTVLTPSKGFSIELGAAISVLIATKLGFPISTTHCKVGSVVIVGLVSSRFCGPTGASTGGDKEALEESQQEAAKESTVDWKLFGNIAITWIITVPLSASASAIVMVILRWLAL